MPIKSENLVRSALPGWCGLGALVLSLWVINKTVPAYIQAVIVIGIIFAAMFVVEAYLSIKGNYGLIGASSKRPLNFKRIFFKIIGWLITIGTVSSAYWIFPEYLGSFYYPYYKALLFSWPYLTGFFLICIIWEDRRSEKEEDFYYWIGRGLLTQNLKLLKKVNLKQHFLAWVVKLYFLPLMFIYLVNYLNSPPPTINSVIGIYEAAFNFIFLIDTAFVCVGYIFANNLTDTNIRSTEPTLLGWISALICYQPFWGGVIGSCYLSYGSSWETWLKGNLVLQTVWAFLILLSLLLYIWATIAFGSRFSNLTHRGILVCGPYAYLKHPAYIGKMVSFFLIYVPFLGKDFLSIFRNCILWALLGGVYYLRAKTEEAHLRSVGPEYDLYAQEVSRNWKNLWKF